MGNPSFYISSVVYAPFLIFSFSADLRRDKTKTDEVADFSFFRNNGTRAEFDLPQKEN